MHPRAIAIAVALGALEIASSAAFGQAGVSVTGASGGVNNGFLIGTHGFFFSDNSSLGSDALTDGTTVYSRFDAQLNRQVYYSGLGLFYELDTFGTIQKDTAVGIVIEGILGSFYFKIMPGFIEETFKERSFSKRSGNFLAFEGGIRGALWRTWSFYEVAIQRRTLTINQEDGRQMTDKITKTEMFPVFGMGLHL